MHDVKRDAYPDSKHLAAETDTHAKLRFVPIADPRAMSESEWLDRITPWMIRFLTIGTALLVPFFVYLVLTDGFKLIRATIASLLP
jgi:hypothetical protein